MTRTKINGVVTTDRTITLNYSTIINRLPNTQVPTSTASSTEQEKPVYAFILDKSGSMREEPRYGGYGQQQATGIQSACMSIVSRPSSHFGQQHAMGIQSGSMTIVSSPLNSVDSTKRYPGLGHSGLGRSGNAPSVMSSISSNSSSSSSTSSYAPSVINTNPAQPAGPAPIELAKQVASSAVNSITKLSEQAQGFMFTEFSDTHASRVQFIGFDDPAFFPALAQLNANILNISAGGGTYLYPALEKMRLQLEQRNIPEGSRIVLFVATDGQLSDSAVNIPQNIKEKLDPHSKYKFSVNHFRIGYPGNVGTNERDYFSRLVDAPENLKYQTIEDFRSIPSVLGKSWANTVGAPEGHIKLRVEFLTAAGREISSQPNIEEIGCLPYEKEYNSSVSVPKEYIEQLDKIRFTLVCGENTVLHTLEINKADIPALEITNANARLQAMSATTMRKFCAALVDKNRFGTSSALQERLTQLADDLEATMPQNCDADNADKAYELIQVLREFEAHRNAVTTGNTQQSSAYNSVMSHANTIMGVSITSQPARRPHMDAVVGSITGPIRAGATPEEFKRSRLPKPQQQPIPDVRTGIASSSSSLSAFTPPPVVTTRATTSPASPTTPQQLTPPPAALSIPTASITSRTTARQLMPPPALPIPTASTTSRVTRPTSSAAVTNSNALRGISPFTADATSTASVVTARVTTTKTTPTLQQHTAPTAVSRPLVSSTAGVSDVTKPSVLGSINRFAFDTSSNVRAVTIKTSTTPAEPTPLQHTVAPTVSVAAVTTAPRSVSTSRANSDAPKPNSFEEISQHPYFPGSKASIVHNTCSKLANELKRLEALALKNTIAREKYDALHAFEASVITRIKRLPANQSLEDIGKTMFTVWNDEYEAKVIPTLKKDRHSLDYLRLFTAITVIIPLIAGLVGLFGGFNNARRFTAAVVPRFFGSETCSQREVKDTMNKLKNQFSVEATASLDSPSEPRIC